MDEETSPNGPRKRKNIPSPAKKSFTSTNTKHLAYLKKVPSRHAEDEPFFLSKPSSLPSGRTFADLGDLSAALKNKLKNTTTVSSALSNADEVVFQNSEPSQEAEKERENEQESLGNFNDPARVLERVGERVFESKENEDLGQSIAVLVLLRSLGLLYTHLVHVERFVELNTKHTSNNIFTK